MKLRETILKEHSKANCRRIVKWVGDDQIRFDELFDLFLSDEYRVVQRTGWPLSYCVEDHPKFIQKHFGKLLKNLDKKGIHEAVKRNTVRLLQYVTFLKDLAHSNNRKERDYKMETVVRHWSNYLRRGSLAI